MTGFAVCVFDIVRFTLNLLRQIDGDTEETLSYRQFLEHMQRARTGLWQLGVRKGDVILVLSPNCMQTPIIMFAAFSLGAIYTSCNFLCSKGRICCGSNVQNGKQNSDICLVEWKTLQSKPK